MPKLTPVDKMRFKEYVADAAKSDENLAFLLDNLGSPIVMDWSVESLAKAEAVFWRCVSDGMPAELEGVTHLDHFAHLLGQYLGQCVVRHAGGSWIQSQERNRMFGQPCVDGFGNKPWERVYPVEAAIHLRDLPRHKPEFPGVRERRVMAADLERALAVHRRAQEDVGGPGKERS